MADQQPTSEEQAVESSWRPERGWRDLWQAPALALGAALLAAGLFLSLRAEPKHDFDGALDDVEALVQQEQYTSALERLNNDIVPHLLAEPNAPSMVIGRSHLLRADALFLGQIATNSVHPDNHLAVIEEYDKAERLLVALSPERVARYATSLAAIGRESEAIERARQLPAEASSMRHDLIRRIIEQLLAGPSSRHDRALELLTELRSDPMLSEEDRIWTIATQARLRLEGGYLEEAVDHLLLALQRNLGMADRDAAQLYVLLARAYQELGRMTEAEHNVDRAEQRLSPADRLIADVHLIRGRIAQGRGDLSAAREAYSHILADNSGGPVWFEGLLGVSETQSMLGELAAALESYRRLVQELKAQGEQPGVTRTEVADSLLDQVSGALAREDYAAALQFAEIAQSLYESMRVPAAVSLSLARSRRLLADEMLSKARLSPNDPPDPSLLEPVTRTEVRAHYFEAGQDYLAYARDMILTDDDAFADSLWNAGECFDLAGDLDRAIEVFSEYANGRPNDPRRPAAVFKLAQAHQAKGDYQIAAQFYRDLIAANPNSGEGTRSYVWLARTLLQDEDSGNDGEAEQLLRRVVDGGMLAPDAIDFRNGLVELGRYHYRRHETEEAIRRLDEVSRRFTTDHEIQEVRFELADSHRRRAEELVRLLETAMPEAQRRRVEQQRIDHLTEAMRLFEVVRAELQGKDERRLTGLQKSHLRNAYFYKADCAFDLKDYDLAIEFYDTAAQRFAEEPVSLVAMAQIVSAFIEQGRLAEARKANERARQRLNEFPDGAFDSSDLPFTRKHWERWLDSTDALSRAADSERTSTAAAPS